MDFTSGLDNHRTGPIHNPNFDDESIDQVQNNQHKVTRYLHNQIDPKNPTKTPKNHHKRVEQNRQQQECLKQWQKMGKTGAQPQSQIADDPR